MNLKAHRGLVGTAATVALTTVVAVFITASPGASAGTPWSAYALGATGTVPIDKTPYIESTGEQKTSTLLEVPTNPLVSVAAATVSAGKTNGSSVELLDTTVGPDLADQIPELPEELTSACDQLPANPSLDDLPLDDLPELPIPGLPAIEDLPVSSLPELCELLLTPPTSILGVDVINIQCLGTTGSVDIGGLEVLGQEIDLPTIEPNMTIPAAPLATITINKQTTHADGSFSVQGLVIDLLDGTETIVLGEATCGKAAKTTTPAPPAPTPTPVPTSHPVTG